MDANNPRYIMSKFPRPKIEVGKFIALVCPTGYNLHSIIINGDNIYPIFEKEHHIVVPSGMKL